jgi:membrane-associated phospholipid phosphatase
LLAFVVALLVGYSRIYLAQHFPLDVGGGIIVAICSVIVSVAVHKWFANRQVKHQEVPSGSDPFL